jgi:uncharacterized protein
MRSLIRRNVIPVAAVAAALALAGGFMVQNAGARSNVGAPVHAASTGHTISVSAQGTVNVAPDMATVTLGVQTKADDAATALKNNASKMTAVISAVEAQGVPANKIQTSDLSLNFDDQNSVYVASHTITVEVDTIANVGPILDAAVNAGANNSWGVQFGLKDSSAANSQALQAAVVAARKHADAIATGLGVSITGVGSAAEPTFSSPIPYGASPLAASAAASTPIQPGELSISANVQVVYTFG